MESSRGEICEKHGAVKEYGLQRASIHGMIVQRPRNIGRFRFNPLQIEGSIVLDEPGVEARMQAKSATPVVLMGHEKEWKRTSGREGT